MNLHELLLRLEEMPEVISDGGSEERDFLEDRVAFVDSKGLGGNPRRSKFVFAAPCYSLP